MVSIPHHSLQRREEEDRRTGGTKRASVLIVARGGDTKVYPSFLAGTVDHQSSDLKEHFPENPCFIVERKKLPDLRRRGSNVFVFNYSSFQASSRSHFKSVTWLCVL